MRWSWKFPFRVRDEDQYEYGDYTSKLTVDLDDVTAFSPFYSDSGRVSKVKSIIKVRDIGDLIVKTSYSEVKLLKGLHETKMGF